MIKIIVINYTVLIVYNTVAKSLLLLTTAR